MEIKVDGALFDNNNASGAAAMHIMCGGLPCHVNLTRVNVTNNRFLHSGYAEFHASSRPKPGFGYSCGQYGASAILVSDYSPRSQVVIRGR